MKHTHLTNVWNGLKSLLLLCTLIAFQLNAQESQLSGKLRIKLTEEMSRTFEKTPVQKTAAGFINVGSAELNALHSQFKVTNYKRVFPYAGKYEEKHRKYGLHLWYELDLADDQDIQNVMKYYAKAGGIQIAEPIFKKQRIEPLQSNKTVFNSNKANANDPFFLNQWGYYNEGQTGGVSGADISLIQAWDIATGSSDVIVSVMDGGIDIKHEDLAPNLWVNVHEIPGNGIDDDNNGYIDDIHGYGFGDNSSTIAAGAHGTHVAGTVAAVSNNRIGVAGVAGGDGSGNGVRLMSCAVFGANDVGNFDLAYVYAADNGAVISQNSWGYSYPGNYEESVKDAIGYFIAEAGYDEAGNPVGPMQGGLVIFAAGNDSSSRNDYYPGADPRVMAIASTDHNDFPSNFTNRGDWIDLAAPGTDIGSTFPDNSYAYLSGTSMACPHVSGVAALIVSKFSGDITPDQIRARLVTTADPLSVSYLGSGRLNAFAALQDDDDTAPDPITDLVVTGTEDTTITISWTTPGSSEDNELLTYEVRYDTVPINEDTFESATLAINGNQSTSSGTSETFTLTGLEETTTYYVAIQLTGFSGIESEISNVVSGTTKAGEVSEGFEVNPEYLLVDIDVSVTPLASEKIEIKNGFDQEVSYTAELVVFGDDSRSSSTRLLFPGDEYENMDMSLYGVGLDPGSVSPQTQGISREALSVPSESAVTIIDSIYYDSGDEIADDFYGSGNAETPFTTAVRFEVDRPTFKLTHIRNFFKTVPLDTPTSIVEVYKGSTITNAELLIAQEVSLQSEEGDFFTIPLAIPQDFVAGDVFWVLHKFPSGILYPQGTEEFNFESKPDTFYFSLDGGVTFKASVGTFKLWALSSNETEEQDWIVLDRYAGVIPAGGTDEINVSFDATDIEEGGHDFYVFVQPDVDSNPFQVWGYAEVSGQTPDMSDVEEILDFGTLFLENEKTGSISITNTGLGELAIFDIVSDNEDFTPDRTSYYFSPGGTDTIDINFSPSMMGVSNGSLTFSTNDPDIPQFTISMIGVVIDPPVISVDPESIVTEIKIGETTTERITITNEGNYPLTFSFPEIAASNQIDARVAVAEREEDRTGDTPSLLGSGSDDGFGYTWIDSNEPDGPVYVWNDIKETGIEINNVGTPQFDGLYTTIELPFGFPFYGEEITSLKIHSRGMLILEEFTDQYFINRPIPSPYFVNGFIAPFGHPDLRDDPTAPGKMYYQITGDNRLIVQYDEVPDDRYADDSDIGTITFQVVLERNGNIMFYYKNIGDLDDAEDATIGIENMDGTKGVSIADRSEVYVEDEMAVLITAPQLFIDSASVLSGTVGVGKSVDVDITLYAQEYYKEGIFTNDLIISSNDPVNPLHSVPVTITAYGEQDIAVVPDLLNFPDTFVGGTSTLNLTVVNTGTKSIQVEQITNGSSEFTFDFGGNTLIEAGAVLRVPVTYSPVSAVVSETEIEVYSDVEAKPVLLVNVIGKGVDPPVIELDMTALQASANAGEKVRDSLLITNTGAYPLVFTAKTPFWLDTEETDDGENSYSPTTNDETGTMANQRHGGTDVDFGYVWEDNKTGGGVSYVFDDITTTGTDITSELSYAGQFADNVFKVDMGMDFPFYGQMYTSVWISPDGFLTFEDPDADSNDIRLGKPIPQDDFVNNLIAAFWGDLEPGTVNGTVHYESKPDYFVVQYTEVTAYNYRYTPDENITFQVLLYPDGTIKFMYEDVEDSAFLDYGTIGIENAAGDDGIQISFFGTEYVQDGLSVVIHAPKTRTIAPGESTMLPLIYDASGLADGMYEEQLKIENNDPLHSDISIPVTFTVTGSPILALSSDEIDFGEVIMSSETLARKDQGLIIRNEGTKSMLIESIQLENEAFTTYASLPVTIEPQEDLVVQLSFVPDAVADYSGDLIITTDDATYSRAVVSLKGRGVELPVFVLETASDSIYARVRKNGIVHDQIRFVNENAPSTGGTLMYNTNVSYHLSEGSANHSVIDSIYYDPSTRGESFMGLSGDTDLNTRTAVKFTVGNNHAFELTHIKNKCRLEAKVGEEISIKIYRGGALPEEGMLLTEQFYKKEFDGTYDELGGYDLIALEEPQSFTTNETFWLVIDYPDDITWPQGFVQGAQDAEETFYLRTSDLQWRSIESIDYKGFVFQVRALGSGTSGWLTLDPDMGTIPASEDTPVQVQLDATGLDSGDYFATLHIDTNDLKNPKSMIPVRLTVNEIPQFYEKPSDTLEIQEQETLKVILQAADPDGEVTAYTLDENYANVIFNTTQESAIIEFIPDYHQSGYFTFTVNAYDDIQDVSTVSFVVKVNDVNRAPYLIDQIPTQIYKKQSQSRFDLSAYIKDPDLDTITYEVSTERPDLLELTLEGEILEVKPLEKGQTFVSIVAHDHKGGVVGTSFEAIIRRVNRAPIVRQLISSKKSETTDDTLKIDITNVFMDPDGDELQYTIISDSPNIASGMIKGKQLIVSQTGVGEVHFDIIANDGYGGEATTDFITKVDQVSGGIELLDKEQLMLFNAPNPFRYNTTINYHMEKADHVLLEIYSYDGKLIDVLIDEQQEAGYHQVTYKRTTIESGVYFCRIDIGGEIIVNKMMIK